MSADATYQTTGLQRRQDGTTAVPSGGSLDVESGGALKLAGTALTPSAAQINALAGGSSTVAADRTRKIARVALAAVDSGGGVVSWQNPEASSIIVTRIVLDVTTVATGACSVSAGTTAASGTTSVANLIDTLDVHSAIGTFDNITDKGSGGKSRQKLASGKWVTVSVASGASAGLVGFAYIEYFVI